MMHFSFKAPNLNLKKLQNHKFGLYVKYKHMKRYYCTGREILDNFKRKFCPLSEKYPNPLKYNNNIES